MARTLRTPPTAQAPRSMACRPIRLESRVVRCGMVSKPCASRAPAEDHGVHAHAGERSAIDVDGIDLAGSHTRPVLFHDALDGDAFGRVNFHGDDKFFGLDFFPEFAIGLASRHPAKSFGGLDTFDGARPDWFVPLVFIEMNFLTASAIAWMCSGVVPQQPPIRARAQLSSFLGEECEIFGRGAWVHDTVADTLGKTCVGHDAERQGGAGSEFAQHGKQSCGPMVQFAPMD